MKRKEPLVGYMILEDWTDDMSDFSGVITGPDDPTGANLAWEKPIKMIEYSVYSKLFRAKRLQDIAAKSAVNELDMEIRELREEVGSLRYYKKVNVETTRLLTEQLQEALKDNFGLRQMHIGDVGKVEQYRAIAYDLQSQRDSLHRLCSDMYMAFMAGIPEADFEKIMDSARDIFKTIDYQEHEELHAEKK